MYKHVLYESLYIPLSPSPQASSGVFGTSTFSTLGLTRKTKVTEPPTFVARTFDSLADVTVTKVVCGDLFMACLTGEPAAVSHWVPVLCGQHLLWATS